MKTTTRVVWLGPVLESDKARVPDGRVQSIWGVEIAGVLTGSRFTSKRAATRWAQQYK